MSESWTCSTPPPPAASRICRLVSGLTALDCAVMREVYVNQDFTRVGYYKSILDEAGIPNLIRNELTHNWMTELPSPIFFPALCVLHDEDYDRAIQLLAEIHYAPPSNLPDWFCPRCN